jgi:hypothetical protein
VAPTQRFLTIIASRVRVKAGVSRVVGPDERVHRCGFQFVGEWAYSVRSYKVGPKVLSFTTTRTEVGVQIAWNRYTFAAVRG